MLSCTYQSQLTTKPSSRKTLTMTPAEITLPPGCLLGKANSSDQLKFKQIERRNTIRNYWPFLVSMLVLTLIMTPLINDYPWLFALNIGFLWVPVTSRIILMYFSHKTTFFDISNTWYIKCQGRLVAWVTLSPQTKGSLILILFVEKAWRRRGLGSALVKRLIQEVHPPISLYCNHKLVSFYSHLGFVRSHSNILGFSYMVYKGLEK